MNGQAETYETLQLRVLDEHREYKGLGWETWKRFRQDGVTRNYLSARIFGRDMQTELKIDTRAHGSSIICIRDSLLDHDVH